MNSSLFLLGIDIASIVCAALLGAALIATFPRRRSAQLIALISICTICYIVLARVDYSYWIPTPFHVEVGGWYGLLNFARNLTPGLFMLLSFTLFASQRRFPRWLLGLFLMQMALEEPARSLVRSDWHFYRALTQLAPTLLQVMFTIFALYWAIASWRTDLIETRRRTRALTIFVIALNVIASSLLLRVVIDPNTVANYHAHVALVAVNLATLLFVLFRVLHANIGSYLEYLPAQQQTRSPPMQKADPEMARVLAKLASLLQVERIYREPGLSLQVLADRVKVPEYRLRKIIHEQLGFNNYNAYLHSYRIREACEQFRDPAKRRTPILTIALSVGYQSVNTFNRGFRDLMGVTPSAYRLQDSALAGDHTEKISPKNE